MGRTQFVGFHYQCRTNDAVVKFYGKISFKNQSENSVGEKRIVFPYAQAPLGIQTKI